MQKWKGKMRLTENTFCVHTYNFVPYCAFWNLSEKGLHVTCFKELIQTVDRIFSEYVNGQQGEVKRKGRYKRERKLKMSTTQ
jgi:hypothetical protein